MAVERSATILVSDNIRFNTVTDDADAKAKASEGDEESDVLPDVLHNGGVMSPPFQDGKIFERDGVLTTLDMKFCSETLRRRVTFLSLGFDV